jgi:hypothetical protein
VHNSGHSPGITGILIRAERIIGYYIHLGGMIVKYILAEMVTERLIREIGMVAKPLPEQIKILETELPTGKARFESALYQAEKLKKITIGKRSLGNDGGGTVVMMVADDTYDIPFILADIAFDSIGKGSITVGFQLRPLVKDEESTKKYIDPFLTWYNGIDKLPSEPVHLDIGEFLKANPAPLNYLGRIPYDYLDEVLKFTEQFFDILLDIYWKAEPVTDAQRRKKMEAFRSEYNQNIFGDDFSGKMLIKAFGRKTAALFYDYLVYL